jgi:hypothetical protein
MNLFFNNNKSAVAVFLSMKKPLKKIQPTFLYMFRKLKVFDKFVETY